MGLVVYTRSHRRVFRSEGSTHMRGQEGALRNNHKITSPTIWTTFNEVTMVVQRIFVSCLAVEGERKSKVITA